MPQRYIFAHLIFARVMVLGLTPLLAEVDAQTRIAFSSDRNGNWDIYVMDTDGKNPRNLTNHPDDDTAPTWFGSAFAVAPTGKKSTRWGWLKQADR